MLRSLGALLCALVLLTVLAPAAGAADPAVRVATFNIHHGAGTDDRLDLDRVARALRGARAEVIGLQEVDNHWSDRSAFADQAAELARMLNMHVAYGANLDLDPLVPGQLRRRYGTAVLSKWEIRESRNTLLPRPFGGEQRGLLETVIRARGEWMRFAVTHLQHTNAEERLAQSTRIAELLDGSVESVVLVGDLNAAPGAPELAPLESRYEDAWVLGGDPADPGYTSDAENPHARIDYVKVTEGLAVSDAVVYGSDASDHLPFAADVQLPR
jgi:endonuclease/exonuclease/phosphatase family metal-dependent hydrolase